MRMPVVCAIVALGIGACGLAAGMDAAGAVYTMTNSPSGNEVLIFHRSADGSLAPAGSASTGGLGTGGGLGNQGALALADSGRWLLAVNAGSSELSLFAVTPDGLRLSDRTASGGDRPVSVTVRGRLAYVLNAGVNNNISGFWIEPGGTLMPLPGSQRPLSGDNVGAAEIQFSPDGDFLLVTERLTNRIDTYQVDAAGYAQGPNVHASSGITPFGFSFGLRNQVFVSEAFGGAADASAVSSYQVESGGLRVISPSAPTTETAACWLAVTKNGRFAYAANAGSGTVTGYRIAPDGRIELLNADGVTAASGPNPVDLAVSGDSRYLYVLNRGGAIGGFRIEGSGALAPAGQAAVPAGVNGIAVR